MIVNLVEGSIAVAFRNADHLRVVRANVVIGQSLLVRAMAINHHWPDSF